MLQVMAYIDEMFPPHARGWTLSSRHRERGSWVSPARAGMDRRESLAPGARLGFPRTRGDGPDAQLGWREFLQFPPHARGWTATTGCPASHVKVSPARAGMDPLTAT